MALPAAYAHAQAAARLYGLGRRLRPNGLVARCSRPSYASISTPRRSVDPGAGPLEYRWDMGDGTTLTGLTITHCYKVRAHYKVVLDVAVPATGEVRRAERTFEVDLTAQAGAQLQRGR